MHTHHSAAQPLTEYGPSALALLAGALLALMIHCNSRLAAYSNPLTASWLAHAIGLLTALLLWKARRRVPADASRPPRWAYLGGVPGALVVALAAITVNSPLAMSGTLALGMAGQMLLGLLSDRFGLFGMPRRLLQRHDALALPLVLSGCAILIFGA
ncbi:DMT family transporter [Pseudogulbenkiania ferrooxidans]|uniref:Membrane protein n=1 Tax=Pseudogulbenkiania ferrooxidans EGD-HP2 TaxID=1388764 RepID=A0ABP2XLT5_9NEIS|nr:DMT family transporter [Pseudogulbenkiania ferrooxidans]ERE04698.1 membrane protein [Pseudogulbenkiania ferrooxidans EGD-HP2]